MLGVGLSPISLRQAVLEIMRWVERGERRYVCLATVHGVMECRRNPGLRAIYNASGLTTSDGMPLVWLLRAGGHRNASRVYGPDLMLELCSSTGAPPLRHFFYGGAPQVAEQLVVRLKQRFGHLQVAGTYSPPFRQLSAEEDAQIVDRINQSGADLVWVGIGTPKQEHWMADHHGRIEAGAMIGVGAAFDFLSGNKAQAPGWVRRSGFEWLFRLLHEPRRLWRRYLILNPLFLLLVAAQLAGLRKFELK